MSTSDPSPLPSNPESGEVTPTTNYNILMGLQEYLHSHVKVVRVLSIVVLCVQLITAASLFLFIQRETESDKVKLDQVALVREATAKLNASLAAQRERVDLQYSDLMNHILNLESGLDPGKVVFPTRLEFEYQTRKDELSE